MYQGTNPKGPLFPFLMGVLILGIPFALALAKRLGSQETRKRIEKHEEAVAELRGSSKAYKIFAVLLALYFCLAGIILYVYLE
jgi:hypothetical protein